MLLAFLIVAVVGYLLGALPVGFLVARAKGVNIFEVGSKNPGATNVRRVLGHGPGNLVLALDAAKGAVAVAVAYFQVNLTDAGSSISFEYSTTPAELARPIVGLVAAILGHSFSCFTGFRGGKSVATGAGGFVVLFPLGMLFGLVVFGVAVAVSRTISLGSMLGAASLPLSAVLLQHPPSLVGVCAAVALFVILRHRANISRLLAGTEAKIGRPAAAQPPLSKS